MPSTNASSSGIFQGSDLALNKIEVSSYGRLSRNSLQFGMCNPPSDDAANPTKKLLTRPIKSDLLKWSVMNERKEFISLWSQANSYAKKSLSYKIEYLQNRVRKSLPERDL
jgi:hypothetical protein